MLTTLNPLDLAQGQALLSRLPDTFSDILRAARLERQAEGRVVVSFEIAGVGKRQVAATSSNEAIRLALVELASFLTTSAGQRVTERMSASELGGEASSSSERSLSKARQQTLGVTLPLGLKEHLNSIASAEATSFAEVSRRFIVFGFEDFVARSLYANPTSLFDLLGRELHQWQDSDSEQVMIRLDPGQAVRLQSTAKEYKKSVSELTALCVAHGIAMQKLLASLELKVSSCKGAAVRRLVSTLGLQSFATPLISSVLVGNVRAPRTLLSRLAAAFEVPESLLSTLFRGNFDRRLVPAFKAEVGKPVLSTAPTTWTSAVKSLQLSQEDTKTLLDLGV